MGRTCAGGGSDGGGGVVASRWLLTYDVCRDECGTFDGGVDHIDGGGGVRRTSADACGFCLADCPKYSPGVSPPCCLYKESSAVDVDRSGGG